MSAVEVIVPWRGGCPHRERALRYVLGRYRWPVNVAPGPDPWVKAEAVNPAVEKSRAEVVVLADADVFCDGLGEAVAAVEAGAAWAIPHNMVFRLTEEATEHVLEGGDWHRQPTCQKPYQGLAGGGYVVVRRDTLLEVPLDPRFVGWGQEDEAHASALHTLAGPWWRGAAPLVHLWHPPQERQDRRRGSNAGWRLRRRYLKARNDPVAMRALLGELDRERAPGGPETDRLVGRRRKDLHADVAGRVGHD